LITLPELIALENEASSNDEATVGEKTQEGDEALLGKFLDLLEDIDRTTKNKLDEDPDLMPTFIEADGIVVGYLTEVLKPHQKLIAQGVLQLREALIERGVPEENTFENLTITHLAEMPDFPISEVEALLMLVYGHAYGFWDLVDTKPQGITRSRIVNYNHQALVEAARDEAMVGENVGGIDLNPQLLDLQIKRDPHGVPLPLEQQPILEMKIDGFYPVIMNVTPIPNLPLMLGFDFGGSEEDVDYGYDYEYNALEVERLSLLN
jgi:hypothetical protein